MWLEFLWLWKASERSFLFPLKMSLPRAREEVVASKQNDSVSMQSKVTFFFSCRLRDAVLRSTSLLSFSAVLLLTFLEDSFFAVRGRTQFDLDRKSQPCTGSPTTIKAHPPIASLWSFLPLVKLTVVVRSKECSHRVGLFKAMFTTNMSVPSVS